MHHHGLAANRNVHVLLRLAAMPIERGAPALWANSRLALAVGSDNEPVRLLINLRRPKVLEIEQIWYVWAHSR